nr:carbohydrate-binding protein [uncultured Comamonas sp.]
MSGGLIVLKPVEVTPAMLTSNIPENDHPGYAPASTYAADVRVIYGHFVYQSLQANNKGNQPDVSSTWWVKVGPTNLWKAFDRSHTTQTVGSQAMWFEIAGSEVRSAIALLNLTGVSSIRVQVTDPNFGKLYDKSEEMLSAQAQSNWYSWFFGKRTTRKDWRALDLPSYPNATIRIDLVGAGPIGVGVILVGDQIVLGDGVRFGLRMGIRDYSRKEADQWGEVALQQRAFSRTRSFSFRIKNEQLDEVEQLLSGLRATPVLWIPSSNTWDSPNVYGWYSSFDLILQYATHSDCSLDIEGLA